MEELTDKERMLLYRVARWEQSGFSNSVSKEDYAREPTASRLVMLESELRFLHERTGETTCAADALELVTDSPLKRAGWVKWYEQNPSACLVSLSGRLSHVSGKPIRIDCKEFSPGNAYFEVITDEGILRRLFSGERARYYDPIPDFTYLYFRVYGENDVIAEGIRKTKLNSGSTDTLTGGDLWTCPSTS